MKIILSHYRTNILIMLVILMTSILVSVFTYKPNLLLYFIVGMVICLIIYRWEWSIYCLLVSSLFNGIMIPFFGRDLRPDNLITLIAIVSVILAILANKGMVNYSLFGTMILYFIYAFIVSLLVSPVYSISLDGLSQLILSVLPMFVLIQIITLNEERVINLFYFYLLTGLLEAIYGIICFIVYSVIGIDLGGLMFAQWGQSVSVKGTFFEANLFGSYMSSCLLFVISLLASNTYKLYKSKYRIILLMSVPILSGALLLSWTRSAWIGFILGMIILVINYGHKIVNIKNVLILVFSFIFIMLPVFLLINNMFDKLSGEKGLFSYKLLNLFESNSGTGEYRLNQYEFAINDFLQNNIFIGNGYFSIKEYGVSSWITNTFLFILHDLGLIGLSIFIYVIFKIVLKGLKAMYLSKENKMINCLVAGILSGNINMIFSTNFTAAHTLAQFWIQLGLLIVITQYANNYVLKHKKKRMKLEM